MDRGKTKVVLLLFAGLVLACGKEKTDAPMEDPRIDEFPTFSAGRPYTYDLDMDGQNDAILTVSPCQEGGTQLCLLVNFRYGNNQSVALPEELREAVTFGPMGKHFPGAYQAIYVYAQRGAPSFRPSVLVVDPNSASLRASYEAPEGRNLDSTYFALAKGPQGFYPFLAPGAGKIPAGPSDPAAWTHLCFFDVSKIDAPVDECGVGFRSANTLFSNDEVPNTLANAVDTFRHQGGWLDDVNGDGWDDIHLPYRWVVKMVSGKDGQTLGANFYNPSLASEPNAPVGFHGGYSFGSFRAFQTSNGERAVLIGAGGQVGNFDSDVECGLSRFHALLVSDSWMTNERAVRWTRYYGYAKPSFQQPFNPLEVQVQRAPQGVDRCVHHFSDGLFQVQDKYLTLHNEFHVTSTYDKCVAEQHAALAAPNDATLASAAQACIRDHALAATGSWHAVLTHAESGLPLSTRLFSSVWGASDKLLPSGEVAFLVEAMPQQLRFDRQGYASGNLRVMVADANHQLQEVATLPIAGRPKTRIAPAREGGRGSSQAGFVELLTSDVDANGLVEIELEGGQRLEYSEAQSAFVQVL